MKINIIQTIKAILLAAVFILGASLVYAWTPPTSAPPAGNVPAPINVGTVDQTKVGGLGVGAFVAESAYFNGSVGIGVVNPAAKLDVAGNVKASGNLQAPTVCLSGDCKSAWPVAGGVADWNTMINIPPDIDDGDQVGITSELDPTVTPSVKDGVSWGEVSGKPAGFADDVDNEGSIPAGTVIAGCTAAQYSGATCWGGATILNSCGTLSDVTCPPGTTRIIYSDAGGNSCTIGSFLVLCIKN